MISPNAGQQYAEPVAAIYRDAELRILSVITQSLAKGIEAPFWEQLQLARLQGVRQAAVRELALTNRAAADLITKSLTDAYNAGGLSAMQDASRVLDAIAAPTLQRQAAVRALAAAMTNTLASAQNSILRAVPDIYQSIVATSTASVVAGSLGRKEATQEAINLFLSKGLSGIQTARGVMDISTYAVMAMRTGTVKSVIQGHLDTMTNNGLDFVTIQPGPRPCEICDSWAGKVLSISGSPAGTMTVPDLSGTGTIDIEVEGSLDDARSDGWGHPNDRCNVSAWLPGVSDPATLERPPWDGEGYKAQQEQRSIERQIRGWKTAEATAITDEAKANAAAKIESWQGAMRSHIDANSYLKRQSSREQISGMFGGRSPLADIVDKIPSATTTPLLDKLPRMTSAESLSDATKGLIANPGNGLNDRYGINCSNVVNAVELRARGFDVIARPLAPKFGDSGRSYQMMEADWVQADGSPAKFIWAKGGQRGLEGQMIDWPEGARGQVVISWRGGGAHTFNVSKDLNGKLHYYEGQVEHDTVGYFQRRKDGSVLGILRTDNLVPTDKLHDVVMAANGPEARNIALDQMARAKLKAEAIAESAAKAARLATPEGELEAALKELKMYENIVDNLMETRAHDDPAVVRYLDRVALQEQVVRELRVIIAKLAR